MEETEDVFSSRHRGEKKKKNTQQSFSFPHLVKDACKHNLLGSSWRLKDNGRHHSVKSPLSESLVSNKCSVINFQF